jgi:hypothetical protein
MVKMLSKVVVEVISKPGKLKTGVSCKGYSRRQADT